jgi:hypothetical protein
MSDIVANITEIKLVVDDMQKFIEEVEVEEDKKLLEKPVYYLVHGTGEEAYRLATFYTAPNEQYAVEELLDFIFQIPSITSDLCSYALEKEKVSEELATIASIKFLLASIILNDNSLYTKLKHVLTLLHIDNHYFDAIFGVEIECVEEITVRTKEEKENKENEEA